MVLYKDSSFNELVVYYYQVNFMDLMLDEFPLVV